MIGQYRFVQAGVINFVASFLYRYHPLPKIAKLSSLSTDFLVSQEKYFHFARCHLYIETAIDFSITDCHVDGESSMSVDADIFNIYVVMKHWFISSPLLVTNAQPNCI